MVGFGYALIATDWDHSLSIGARWSLLRAESGPAVALHATWLWQVPAFEGDARETAVILSAIVSWRWRFGPVFLEAGLGPAVTHDSYRFPAEDYGAANGTLSQRWRYGAVPGGIIGDSFPIDVDLGAGFAF